LFLRRGDYLFHFAVNLWRRSITSPMMPCVLTNAIWYFLRVL
jgi:hypothetical protein